MKRLKKARVKITNGYANKLKSKAKRYVEHDIDCPGLSLKVEPFKEKRINGITSLIDGPKTWIWRYRPQGKVVQTITIGRLEHYSPDKARVKVKTLQNKHSLGKDPIEEKNKWRKEYTLEVGLRDYFSNHLTVSRGYRPKTIKAIKTTFDVWVFRKTKDLKVIRRYPQYALRNKRLSTITSKHVRDTFEAIGSKAPYMANRFVAYLKMFFNYAIDKGWCENNPCTKFDGLYEERPYQDYLTKTERERMYSKALVIDQRSGRLKESYYKETNLNPVACCLILFQLYTSRRTRSEGSILKWTQVSVNKKEMELDQTKTSKKNDIFSFPLGPRSLEILTTIKIDKLNNPESSFFYPPEDLRSKYVFPSKRYGLKNKLGNVCKIPYLVDVRKTWCALLKMSGIDRHLKHYATRHTALSIALSTSKNPKVVAGIGGVTVETAMKYAKTPKADIHKTLEEMDRVEEPVKLKKVN